jgi:pimeloyl-ACP methyl ester carboxylesterase
MAKKLALRVIGLDRPGYGLSDFLAGRKIGDWPDDVVESAEALGIHRFAAPGSSMGPKPQTMPKKSNRSGIMRAQAAA